MLYTRYYMASQFCTGKDILEVACGAGQGLGYLGRRAKKVIGGDYTEHIMRIAKEQDISRSVLLRFDAHTLPFKGSCFDLVILFEAIYYFIRPEQVLEECRRLLRKDGVLLICTANKDWHEFNSSPHSVRYFSAHELFGLLKEYYFDAELFGAFPVTARTAKDRIIAALRRMAVALHLIPKTMEGKAILKRLFYGKLSRLPAHVEDGMAEAHPLVRIATDCPDSQYKVLYAVARAK